MSLSPSWGASVAYSTGLGRVQATENDVILTPYSYQPGVRGVVFCHGAAASASQAVIPESQPGLYALLRRIATRYPVVSCDLGGQQTWGNSTVQTRIETARLYLGSTLGATNAAVFLVGVSMGGVAALNYAASNMAKVKAVVGLSPVSDLNDMYQNDRGSTRAGIQTAYGITFPTALPAGSNPTGNAALNGLAYRAYYGDADTTVVPSTVTTLATQVGGTAISVGNFGHTDSAVAAVPADDVLAFMAANN